MASATLLKNTLQFLGDGGSDAAKFTVSDNQLAFEGTTAGATVHLAGIKDGTAANHAATKSQVDAEATARGSAITAEATRADAYTDGKVGDEVTNRGAAITALTAAGGAVTLAIATETTNREAAIASMKAGLHWKQACRYREADALDYDYSSGNGTLFEKTPGGAGAVDGVTPVVGDRVLITGQTAGAQNGIYTVTAVGNGSTKRKYLRATDFDENAELASAATYVTEGAAHGDRAYVLTSEATAIGGDLQFAPLKATLSDAEVVTSKIDDNAVTADKIADDAVGAEHLAAQALASYAGDVGGADGTFTGDVAGAAATFSGAVQGLSFVATSDKRLKHSFQDLTGGVATDMVNRVPCYSYKFHGQEDTRFGTTAQDLLEHEDLSTLVHTNPDQSYAVNYTDLIPVLCQSLKDAHSRIDELIQSI